MTEEEFENAKVDIAELRKQLKEEKIRRCLAEKQALEASIVSSQIQRREVMRELGELGWQSPAAQ